MLCFLKIIMYLVHAPTGKRKQYDKEGEEMKWQKMEQSFVVHFLTVHLSHF